MREPIFRTSLGEVRGTAAAGVTHVARLRYAQAPVGSLRFALPEPVTRWNGVLDATEGAVVPPQNPSRLAAVMGDYPATQSEDCLHLDIWTPADAAGPMPVLVFIHGGAFVTGGGGMSCYDGAVFAARRRAVVVNISYRLGIFGFLPIPGVAPANLGLRDQIAALRWIRREIAAFGGDPSNVTVAGQSAGAYSIAALLAASQPNELFDKAVMMSLGLGVPLEDLETAAARAGDLLGGLGIAPGDRAALETVPVARLLDAQGALLRASARPDAPDDINPLLRPVIDGDLLAADPAVLLADGRARWCPIILGATREEHAAFYYRNDRVAAIAENVLELRYEALVPGRGAAALAAARRRRPGAGPVMLLSDANSERRYIRAPLRFADQQAAVGGRLWFYMFDWQSPDPEIGACHCIELPFLFGNFPAWRGAPMIDGARVADLDAMSDSFQGAIAGFVRDGAPEAGLGLPWPQFGPMSEVMHFDRLIHCGPYRRFEAYFGAGAEG